MDISMKNAVKVSDGATADKERQTETFEQEQEKAQEERIGHAAHTFNKFHAAYATEHNLTPQELVAAVFLENLNCREFYPTDLGGPAAYDEVCKAISDWFIKNK